MKKICFVYWEHGNRFYLPLDIAQIEAKILETFPSVQVETVKLEAEEDLNKLSQEAQKLVSVEADIFVFMLDNVLWSMVFYARGAMLLSQQLKKNNPQIKIGFQSYKVTNVFVKKIFREIPEIDFCIRGEPEDSFVAFIKKESYEGIPGFTFRKESGELQMNPDAPLLENLDELPSPYLAGVLDSVIKENPGEQLFMATSRGCPFKCHYCARSVKFSRVRTFSIKRVLDELEYLAKKKVSVVFMLDDCFIVSHPRFMEFVEQYEQRFSKTSLNIPELAVMCRPEFLSDEILELFPKVKISFVQIGLQTLHPDCEYLMGRGCTPEDFERIAEKLFQQEIWLHLDIIIGLPNDTLEYFKKTFDFAVDLMPYSLQIKQLYRNPNTLFDLHPEQYGLLTEQKEHLFHVPFVQSSNTFSNQDVKEACNYVLDHRCRNLYPRIKLITEFMRFNDINRPEKQVKFLEIETV